MRIEIVVTALLIALSPLARAADGDQAAEPAPANLPAEPPPAAEPAATPAAAPASAPASIPASAPASAPSRRARREAAPAAEPDRAAAPRLADTEHIQSASGGARSHGPISAGGQISLSGRSQTTTDAFGNQSTTETTSVNLGINGGYFIDKKLMHEVGVQFSETGTSSKTTTNPATTTTKSSSFFYNLGLYYHFNYPLNEQMALLTGVAIGVTGTSSTSASTTITSTEATFEVPLGLKMFVNPGTSVDIIGKVNFGGGSDSMANTTSSVGYGLSFGLTCYLQ